MNTKLCSHCGSPFSAKYDNVKLCWTCFRKRDQALAQYDDLLQEVGRLQAEKDMLSEQLDMMEGTIQRLKAERDARHHASAPIPKPMLQRLIRLSHPDKHAGSELANEVTRWLLQQRRMSA